MTRDSDNNIKDRDYSIALIPGDGIGKEVVSAAQTVLEALVDYYSYSFNLAFENFDWGSDRYKKTGKFMPDDGTDLLKKHSATLFGSVGAPDVPDHLSLWGLLLKIRGPMQLYANVRPVKIFPGTSSYLKNIENPSDIDWVLVRENSEGEYSGHGGRSHIGQPHETATEVAVFTRAGVERILRFAFETAQSRPRKRLTVVTKSNSLRHGLVLWDEVAEQVSKDFPDVTWDKVLVDAMTVRMVSNPRSLDVIVGTNLHMDILSDLAAVLAGSIGLAPSSNLDPTRENPSLFEPVHGSAFDITGKGLANPIATFWSCVEMLKWLGEEKASYRLMRSLENVVSRGETTRDLGGSLTTEQVTQAVCNEIPQARI